MDNDARKQEYRERYLFYKQHRVCPSCGTRNAAPGRVRCETCLAVSASRSRKAPDPQRAKEARERRKAAGKCVWCGRPRAKDSKCYCVDCRLKNHRRLEARRDCIPRSERPAYGLCYICAAPIQGGSLCDKCRERSIGHLKAPPQDSAWRQYHKRGNAALFGNA